MNFKSVITGLLSKAYKQDEKGELIQLLKKDEIEGITEDELLQKLLDVDAARITSITNASKDANKEHYSRGKKETMTDFEKSLKEKFPSLKDSDAKGVDLVAAIVEANSKEKEITDNDILKHPTYQALEQRLKSEKESEVTRVTNEFAAFKTNVEKGKVLETVESKLFSLRDSLGAVIPQSKDRALRTEQNLRRDLQDFTFEVSENGSVLVLQDGKVLQDAHGNTKDFESFAKEQISGYYEFQANNGGGNNGSGKEPQGGGGSKEVKTFKTSDELFNYLDSDATAEEKEATINANAHLVD